MKTIKVNLDSDGKAHICLYGEHIVLGKDKFNESGKAKFTKFGEEYVAEIAQPTKKHRQSTKAKAETIDTPDEQPASEE